MVNNAGYGLLGAIEEVSEDMRRQIEVNLFGMLNVTRAVLRRMRERRSGQFISISSVGGTREYIDQENGNQQRDPVLAARAMISADEADEPPLRLPLGQDSLDQVRAKLDEIRQ